ncbi:MAG: phosphoenolpyruvate carboxykinase (GTP) [Thaumarchaeota archaeon]|nr:phosphoenolpyruvate carboxykinase (GTP) [Nitrososphaerota archaeon]
MALVRAQVRRISGGLVDWVDEVANRTRPDGIVWCDGSEEERRAFVSQMLKDGTLIELDQKRCPGCYLHRSHPDDVARTEASTFICTIEKGDAGPTNNWMDSREAEKLLWRIFDGCMVGRTLYVVPYLMGPGGSPRSQVGVEVTDSLYVVVSLGIMTRMGAVALESLRGGRRFVRGIHSTGTMDHSLRYICHFPESELIMSVNSNYGGNAFLSKKSHSLRIASVSARKEGWLAEHMFVVGIGDASGKLTYVSGAFPSASGKTNLAMLSPPPNLDKFKVWLIGDDIAWLELSPDGRLHAINPEVGCFCVASNSSEKTNPNLMEAIRKNTIFTNVGMTAVRGPWWDALPPAASVLDWQGRPWKPGGAPAAHPNSRFTFPIAEYPMLSPNSDDPRGVPISAILFGGRRSGLVPLVCEAFSWEHGVLLGAMMKVETTAAAEGAVGKLREDPMAMRPFCGYNMSDYFQHWLDFSRKSKNLPKIFQVNWFRKGKDGRFLWPGYGENLRVLKWIVGRVNGRAEAVKTPIGYVPAPGSLDLEGLELQEGAIEELLRVDREGWLGEASASEEFLKTFGERLPKALWREHRDLVARLQA